MPRTALILIRKHGSENWSLVAAPQDRIDQQSAQFTADYCHSPHHAEVAEAQLWTSDAGIYRHRRLTPPPSPEAPPTPSAATAPALSLIHI